MGGDVVGAVATDVATGGLGEVGGVGGVVVGVGGVGGIVGGGGVGVVVGVAVGVVDDVAVVDVADAVVDAVGKMKVGGEFFKALLPVGAVGIPVKFLPSDSGVLVAADVDAGGGEFGDDVGEIIFEGVDLDAVDVGVGVAEVDGVGVGGFFDFVDVFGLAVALGFEVEGGFAVDDDVVAVLVGAGNGAGDAVVLVGSGKFGGEGFFDVEGAGAVCGLVEVVVGGEVAEVEGLQVGGSGRGDGGECWGYF